MHFIPPPPSEFLTAPKKCRKCYILLFFIVYNETAESMIFSITLYMVEKLILKEFSRTDDSSLILLFYAVTKLSTIGINFCHPAIF
jgi:hypothetical protein